MMDNYEGSKGLDLERSGQILVTKIDKIYIIDANTFKK